MIRIVTLNPPYSVHKHMTQMYNQIALGQVVSEADIVCVNCLSTTAMCQWQIAVVLSHVIGTICTTVEPFLKDHPVATKMWSVTTDGVL